MTWIQTVYSADLFVAVCLEQGGTVTIITMYGGMKETLMASVLVTTWLVSVFDDCGFYVKYR